MIDPPVPQTVVYKETQQVTRSWLTWFQQATAILLAVQSSGTTAHRPIASAGGIAWIGRTYFDTTLGKPIWIKSVAAAPPYTITWCDSTGATV